MSMSHYRHFTIDERESLLVYLSQGKKNSEIAKLLNRSPSTISRELRRNTSSRSKYSALQAQKAYEKRRKRCVRRCKHMSFLIIPYPDTILWRSFHYCDIPVHALTKVPFAVLHLIFVNRFPSPILPYLTEPIRLSNRLGCFSYSLFSLKLIWNSSRCLLWRLLFENKSYIYRFLWQILN